MSILKKDMAVKEIEIGVTQFGAREKR